MANWVAAAKTALLGCDGRFVGPEAARRLDTTPLPGRAALIVVLGEKGAKQEIERLFVLAADAEPATRAAALGALAKLAGEDEQAVKYFQSALGVQRAPETARAAAQKGAGENSKK